MKHNVEFITRTNTTDEDFKKEVQAVLDAISVNTRNQLAAITYQFSDTMRSCMIVYDYIEDDSIFMPQHMILNESNTNEEV